MRHGLALAVALSLAAAPAAAAQEACDPRLAAALPAQVSENFRAQSLSGIWQLRMWVNAEGLPDTVIAGELVLRPRVPGVLDSATARVIPVIGYTTVEIEYVPGIEPFRTPVENRSDNYPGVELRLTADGPTLILGNPTVLNETVITLQPPIYASLAMLTAFPDAFAGRWELLGQRDRSAGGGFCAQRLR